MERVSLIPGDPDLCPLILVAPHGHDDENTDIITEKIAESLNCFAVINRGYERADNVDYFKDKADLNNIEHCNEDVIKDEFLDPIKRYVDRIHQTMQEANIFVMHGMANVSSPNDVDAVIGFGDALKPSHSCALWRKNGFMYILRKETVMGYQGKAGGKYAGARKNNLNQYYRQWELDESVHSMQVELVRSLRVDKDQALLTAEAFAICFENYLEFLEKKETGKLPTGFSANWEEVGRQTPNF